MKKIILVLMFVFTAPLVFSLDEKESLRGIKEVLPYVQCSYDDEILNTIIPQETIQNDVELKLRLAGVNVVSLEEYPEDKEREIFFVNVQVIKHNSYEVYFYVIDVDLLQAASLSREPSISLYMITWGTGGHGYCGIRRIQDIRDHIKDLMDEFLNAYLSVNPK